MLSFDKLSIQTKLTLVMLLTNFLVLLLVGLALVVNETSNQRQASQAQLLTLAGVIGANSVSPLVFNDLNAAEKNLAVLKSKPDVVFALIQDPQKS